MTDEDGMDDWRGLYSQGWSGEIVPEAFAHPAKFSRALIRHIYAHAVEEGWLAAGDAVLDPFGGVALGGLEAGLREIRWVGCELEPRFVALGRENIALWSRRFSHPGIRWVEPVLLEGDSRRLSEVVRAAGAVVGSPPYSESCGTPSGGRLQAISGGTMSSKAQREAGLTADYGTTPGQLGAMKEGDIGAVVGSPPFAKMDNPGRAGFEQYTGPSKVTYSSETKARREAALPSSPGQLGAMPEGVISSPPFRSARADTTDSTPSRHGGDCTERAEAHAQQYGSSAGQLARMAEGVVSSPPYEGQQNQGGDQATHPGMKWKQGERQDRGVVERQNFKGVGYGSGEMGSGETFWSAARQIVSECHAVLKPGAHAIWVVKHFVRKGALVDFPGQWQAMCEAAGFTTVHVHRAWLVEDHGTQGGLFGEDTNHTTERKSFFRRLAERKGSPRIDFETVLCMERGVQRRLIA